MSAIPSLARCSCLALTLLSSLAVAQHESRWYKVELMVFTHENPPGGEAFEPTPALGYPEDYRFLLHPQQILEHVQQHEGPSELDEFGRLRLLPPPTEQDTPDIPLREALASDPNTPVALPPADAANDPNEAEAAPRPTPFIALPASQREFRGKAAYMARTGEYRILFHEAWAQPVMGREQAIPLVLDRSGDSGDWPELQGSITLHVARYLHLETRLWLNTRGEYLPGDWRMPSAPLGPPSVITVEPELPESELADPNDLLPGGEVTVYESEAFGDLDLPMEEEEEELEPQSPWRHAVLLEQRRRMRSLEVHYLDHPLLSVVIKLEPIDEEQLAAMAAAEEALLPQPSSTDPD